MLVNSAPRLYGLNFALKSERIEAQLMQNRMNQMSSSQMMSQSQSQSIPADSQATIMNIETSNSLFT